MAGSSRTVLITGAAGNLGSKLRRHLQGRYDLRLIDRDPRGDAAIVQADLAQWDRRWVELFSGAGAVVHLAADPMAHQIWPHLIGPNIDGTIHMFQAAAQSGVQRVIFASSNHVMGGYQDDPVPRLTTEMPPRPGARYVSGGQQRDSTPYGSAKLFGERVGKCFAEAHPGLSVVAVRIGWVRPGDNRPEEVPVERGPWFRLMWLSNRDYCQLMERCLVAELPERFVVVNGMSDNTGMRWDLEDPRRILGYQPQDDVTRPGPAAPS